MTRPLHDAEVLQELREDPELLAVADAVAATARGRRSHSAARLAVGGAAAVAALVALLLASPWSGGRTGLVEQALAAVGDGPVLHAVIRVSGERRIEIATGRERPAYVFAEIWRDERAGLLRIVTRKDGVQLADAVTRIGSFEGAMLDPFDAPALYRRLLEDGKARVVGEGLFRGRRVVWLALEPSPDDRYRWRAAIDPVTHELRAQRVLRGDEVVYSIDVLRLEALPEGSARIEPPAGGVDESGGSDVGSSSVSGSAGAGDEGLATLPPDAVWAGRHLGGLALAHASKEHSTVDSGGRTAEADVITLDYGHAWQGLYDVSIGETLGAAGARYRRVSGDVPPPGGFMEVTEGQVDAGEAGSAGGSLSPSGPRTRWTGRLRSHGAYVTVEAWSRSDLLRAARALRPIGAGGP